MDKNIKQNNSNILYLDTFYYYVDIKAFLNIVINKIINLLNKNFKIYWGTENNYIDVTDICYTKCLFYTNIIIPYNEIDKINLFGDHLPKIIKYIKVVDIDNNFKIYETINNEIIVNLEKKNFKIYEKINNEIIINLEKKNFKFYWGVENNYIDVTDICYTKCLFNTNIIIPYNEFDKINLFGDHLPTIIKYIKVVDIDIDNNFKIYETINNEIIINLEKNLTS
jgi:hypothetical protein